MTFCAKLDHSEKNGFSAVQLRLHSQIYNYWRSGKTLKKLWICRFLVFNKKGQFFMFESGLKFEVKVIFVRYWQKTTFSKLPQNQAISSKFSKSFRGTRDLVVFYEFLCVLMLYSGLNSPSTTKSQASLKLFGNLIEIAWRCFD